MVDSFIVLFQVHFASKYQLVVAANAQH